MTAKHLRSTDTGEAMPGRNYPVRDLRHFLQGAWRLRRRGWSAGPVATMRLSGTARFDPSDYGLLFDETGTMVLGDYRGEAIRRYEIRMCAQGAADVFFDDGRLFHHLDLTGGRTVAEHVCGADFYRGTIRVLCWNRWIQRWTITGPRKQQSLTSLFTRISAD